jgi:hypothetical protein
MVFRRFRALMPLAVGVLLASGLVVGVGAVVATPASAQQEITICLANSRNYCADVEDSVNNSGQPIWLWEPSAGAHDYEWGEEGVSCNDTTGVCVCPNEECVEFEDEQNPNLCLGVAANSDHTLELIGCVLGPDGLLGGTARAAWYFILGPNGYYIVSAWLGAGDGGYMAVNGPLNNGNPLYANYYSAPGGGVWEQWTGVFVQ